VSLNSFFTAESSASPIWQIVALDWVVVRRFRTLMAAAVIQGRALPSLWVSYRDRQPRTSQNRLEEDLLSLLRVSILRRVQVIAEAERLLDVRRQHEFLDLRIWTETSPRFRRT